MQEGELYHDKRTGRTKIRPKPFLKVTSMPWSVLRRDKSMIPLFFCAGLATCMLTSFSLYELFTNLDTVIDKRDRFAWMKIKQDHKSKLVNFPIIGETKEPRFFLNVDDLPEKK